MTSVLKNKKRFPLVPVAIFLSLFSVMIWYGYTSFYKKDKKESKTVAPVNALNNKLPAATEKKELNKLELYMQAEKDSVAKRELASNDPYSELNANRAIENKTVNASGKPIATGLRRISIPQNKVEGKNLTSEKEIDQKIAEIYKALGAPQQIQNISTTKNRDTVPAPLLGGRGAGTVGSVDPELSQLEGMLDKLMAIQHPESVKIKTNLKDSVTKPTTNIISFKNSIAAVVHNTQILTNGSTIKLRLTEAITVSGQIIPKGNFLFGICMINNERLTVQLTNATYLNQVIPVSLSVYDIDGIEGIYIPGAISRDVSKEGADQAISSFNLNSYDPSLTGQVANAGLQATKALLSKKVKLVRVTVKAGHHILLQSSFKF